MADNEDEWIRRRAYSLWEEEGRPSGKHAEHWEKARQELAAFRSDKPKRASRTSAAAAAKGSLASSSPAPKKTGSKGAKKPPKQD